MGAKRPLPTVDQGRGIEEPLSPASRNPFDSAVLNLESWSKLLYLVRKHADKIDFKIRADRVETTHGCFLESHTPEQVRFDLPKQSNQNTVMEQGFNANGPHVQAY